MKKVNLHIEGVETPPEEIKKILKGVLGSSPHKNISIAEMRVRVKIMDTIDGAANGVLLIEDSDHDVLKDALENFPWGAANKTLLGMIDAILQAETVTVGIENVKKGKDKIVHG